MHQPPLPCQLFGMAAEDFYVRYYVGHKGKFGHEFLEFEFRPDGKVGQAVYMKISSRYLLPPRRLDACPPS